MLTSRLKIDAAEAERRKCEAGMNVEVDEEAATIVREASRPLINEIRSSFAYLNTGDQPARVARALLVGGGSQLPGLQESLSSQLSVEVGLADPLVRMGHSRRGEHDVLGPHRATAAVPIGLTLGAA